MNRSSQPDPHLHVALLAGGRGTRFWPLSRQRRPKQLLDVTGDGPLLRVTLERIAPLCPPENVLVVTGEDLVKDVRRTVEVPARNVLAEPTGRNTAPAVGLAALVAAERDPDAVLLALPTDHHVASASKLRALLRRGVKAARSLRGLVIFGVAPSGPSTAYGYVVPGHAVAVRGAPGLRRVDSFREKPDVSGARRLLQRGASWNSGMFCLHAAACLEEIDRGLPELGRGLAELRPHVDRRTFGAALRRFYPGLPSLPFDRAVLERSDRVHVLPADVGWSDVGSWESLAALLPGDSQGNRSSGHATFHDAEGCVVVQDPGQTRMLVVLGARDLVLVDAGDVVLACPRGQERDIAGLLARVRRSHPDLC